MSNWNPALPLGYSHVAPGQIANVVTCLEMTEKPPSRPVRPSAESSELRPLEGADLATYRDLFRRVGEDWMWYSRLVMPDETLARIIGDPLVEVFLLLRDGQASGLLELDFRD